MNIFNEVQKVKLNTTHLSQGAISIPDGKTDRLTDKVKPTLIHKDQDLWKLIHFYLGLWWNITLYELFRTNKYAEHYAYLIFAINYSNHNRMFI